MSSRKSLRSFKIFTAGAMAGNLTSAVSNIEFYDNIGIELVFTGTPTGTFSVEVSIDYVQDQNGNVTNAGTWTALSLGATPAATGAAGSIYIDINQMSAPWIRVKYTATSSTGTLNGWICGKSLS